MPDARANTSSPFRWLFGVICVCARARPTFASTSNGTRQKETAHTEGKREQSGKTETKCQETIKYDTRQERTKSVNAVFPASSSSPSVVVIIVRGTCHGCTHFHCVCGSHLMTIAGACTTIFSCSPPIQRTRTSIACTHTDCMCVFTVFLALLLAFFYIHRGQDCSHRHRIGV